MICNNFSDPGSDYAERFLDKAVQFLFPNYFVNIFPKDSRVECDCIASLANLNVDHLYNSIYPSIPERAPSAEA